MLIQDNMPWVSSSISLLRCHPFSAVPSLGQRWTMGITQRAVLGLSIILGKPAGHFSWGSGTPAIWISKIQRLVCPSIHPSIHPSTYPSIHPSTYLFHTNVLSIQQIFIECFCILSTGGMEWASKTWFSDCRRFTVLGLRWLGTVVENCVFFIDYAKAFDCVDHNKRWKILRDGNTRPPDLPLEKSVCRSRSNS